MSEEGMSRYHGLGRREGSALGDGNIEGRIGLMDDLHPLEGDKLLDIGCANGAYTLRMVERFSGAVGIDIEPDRLDDFREAAKGHPVEVLQCSAADTPFEDAAFDAVTAIETVEHLREDLDDTIKETARVLRPGGTFYLTTPNRWWPLEQHGFTFRGRRRPGWLFPFLTWIPAVHRRFSPDDAFTPRRLDRLIEKHGFRRTGLAYMFPPLDGHPALRRRIQPILRLIGRTPLRRFAQTLVMTYERV